MYDRSLLTSLESRLSDPAVQPTARDLCDLTAVLGLHFGLAPLPLADKTPMASFKAYACRGGDVARGVSITTQRLIGAAYKPSLQVGLCGAPVGIGVIDVDDMVYYQRVVDEFLGGVKPTLEVRTARGSHIYVAVPTKVTGRNGIYGPKTVDLKAVHASYVVAPYSWHYQRQTKYLPSIPMTEWPTTESGWQAMLPALDVEAVLATMAASSKCAVRREVKSTDGSVRSVSGSGHSYAGPLTLHEPVERERGKVETLGDLVAELRGGNVPYIEFYSDFPSAHRDRPSTSRSAKLTVSPRGGYTVNCFSTQRHWAVRTELEADPLADYFAQLGEGLEDDTVVRPVFTPSPLAAQTVAAQTGTEPEPSAANDHALRKKSPSVVFTAVEREAKDDVDWDARQAHALATAQAALHASAGKQGTAFYALAELGVEIEYVPFGYVSNLRIDHADAFVMLRAPLASGKTEHGKRLATNLSTVLSMTNTSALAVSNGRRLGVHVYTDRYRDEGEAAERISTTLNSYQKAVMTPDEETQEPRHHDLVLLDEIDACMDYLTSGQVPNPDKVLDFVIDSVVASNVAYGMSADLDEHYALALAKLVRARDPEKRIVYKIMLPKLANRTVDRVTESSAIDRVLDYLESWREGMPPVVLACAKASDAKNYAQFVSTTLGLPTECVSSENSRDEDISEKLRHPDELVRGKALLTYSPAVQSGVSISAEVEQVFVIDTYRELPAETVCQMALRCRNVRNPEVVWATPVWERQESDTSYEGVRATLLNHTSFAEKFYAGVFMATPGKRTKKFDFASDDRLFLLRTHAIQRAMRSQSDPNEQRMRVWTSHGWIVKHSRSYAQAVAAHEAAKVAAESGEGVERIDVKFAYDTDDSLALVDLPAFVARRREEQQRQAEAMEAAAREAAEKAQGALLAPDYDDLDVFDRPFDDSPYDRPPADEQPEVEQTEDAAKTSQALEEMRAAYTARHGEKVLEDQVGCSISQTVKDLGKQDRKIAKFASVFTAEQLLEDEAEKIRERVRTSRSDRHRVERQEIVDYYGQDRFSADLVVLDDEGRYRGKCEAYNQCLATYTALPWQLFARDAEAAVGKDALFANVANIRSYLRATLLKRMGLLAVGPDGRLALNRASNCVREIDGVPVIDGSMLGVALRTAATEDLERAWRDSSDRGRALPSDDANAAKAVMGWIRDMGAVVASQKVYDCKFYSVDFMLVHDYSAVARARRVAEIQQVAADVSSYAPATSQPTADTRERAPVACDLPPKRVKRARAA